MRLRVFVVCAVVLLLAFAGVAYYLLSRPFPISPPTTLGPACEVKTTSGSAALDPTQIANAATITAVGITHKIPDQGIVVALAAALQESKLENLDGGDRDSIGLFQQRPSQGWGTPEQLQDPRYAANKFFTALLRIKNWQSMRVTEAAQRVQRSAYPEAYEQWATEASVLVEALVGQTPNAVTCTKTGEPNSRGPAALTALEAGLQADWGNVTTVANADGAGLTLSVDGSKAGWQYAHWLVAHSIDHAVARVHFANQEWTADTGVWKQVDLSSTGVLADVYRS
jgi:hypothetical protein